MTTKIGIKKKYKHNVWHFHKPITNKINVSTTFTKTQGILYGKSTNYNNIRQQNIISFIIFIYNRQLIFTVNPYAQMYNFFE